MAVTELQAHFASSNDSSRNDNSSFCCKATLISLPSSQSIDWHQRSDIGRNLDESVTTSSHADISGQSVNGGSIDALRLDSTKPRSSTRKGSVRTYPCNFEVNVLKGFESCEPIKVVRLE